MMLSKGMVTDSSVMQWNIPEDSVLTTPMLVEKCYVNQIKFSVSKLWSKNKAKIPVHIRGPEKQKGLSSSLLYLR
jgi:hypothetical protein